MDTSLDTKPPIFLSNSEAEALKSLAVIEKEKLGLSIHFMMMNTLDIVRNMKRNSMMCKWVYMKKLFITSNLLLKKASLIILYKNQI
jgi:hypothetical protein